MSSSVRLVAFDLDGTILRGDTVCEVLARRLGKLERMREMEGITDLGGIAEARHEMAQWYQDTSPENLLKFLDDAQLAPGACEGCAMLKRAGIEFVFVSITWSFAVAHFAQLVGASAWLGTSLETDGSIRHVWPEDKACWLVNLRSQRGLAREQIAAVGDTASDVPMLCSAGLPIFVGRSLPSGLPPTTLHLPAANIVQIAEIILSQTARTELPLSKMAGHSH